MKRTKSAEIKLYAGDNHEYKAVAAHHSVLGNSCSVRAKIQKGVAHSIAAQYSEAFGPVVSVKSRFGDDEATKVKLSMNGKFKSADLKAKFKAPNFIGDGDVSNTTTTTTKVTLGLFVPLELKKESAPLPRMQLGIQYKFWSSI